MQMPTISQQIALCIPVDVDAVYTMLCGITIITSSPSNGALAMWAIRLARAFKPLVQARRVKTLCFENIVCIKPYRPPPTHLSARAALDIWQPSIRTSRQHDAEADKTLLNALKLAVHVVLCVAVVCVQALSCTQQLPSTRQWHPQSTRCCSSTLLISTASTCAVGPLQRRPCAAAPPPPPVVCVFPQRHEQCPSTHLEWVGAGQPHCHFQNRAVLHRQCRHHLTRCPAGPH